jgi:hypothetical protein
MRLLAPLVYALVQVSIHVSFFFSLPVKVAIYFRASLALVDIVRKKLHLG